MTRPSDRPANPKGKSDIARTGSARRGAGRPASAGSGGAHNRSAGESPAERTTTGATEDSLFGTLSTMTQGLLRLALTTAAAATGAVKEGGSSSESARMLLETGAALRDLRELAGLTLQDLAKALNLSDQSLIEAVERGTGTLSFDLILRLSSLLARHDPLPFILRFTRTYNPDIWRLLERWGVGAIPLQWERERHFINIYRTRDEARKLSDADFNRVLTFTQAAFDMALQFLRDGNVPASEEKAHHATGRAGRIRPAPRAGKEP